MAITYIEVDTGRLDGDIQKLSESIGAVKQKYDELTTEFEELNSMWEGRANLAFRAQLESDKQVLMDMINVMQKLENCMDNAKKEYEKCETKVYEMVREIRI